MDSGLKRLPAVLGVVFLVCTAAWGQSRGAISGQVTDGRSGEPLARSEVKLVGTDRATVTGKAGRFRIEGLEAGAYHLRVVTVGYWVADQEIVLGPEESVEVEVSLVSSGYRSDSVEVSAGPFESGDQKGASELSLVGSEVKNLASVLTDDPLRSVQGLPGVASNDDFQSQFSLRGAPFSRIGLYVDDVLLHAPFHMVQGEENSGSVTIFNGDALEKISLIPGAPSVRYADRTAGVLDVQTREGNHERFSVRGTASLSNAGVLAEGSLGKGGGGSWLLSARRSYLKYLIDKTSDETNNPVFDFTDFQGKLSYDFSPKHTLSLTVLNGFSKFDDEKEVEPDEIANSTFHSSLFNLGYRYLHSAAFLVTTRVAYIAEKAKNENRQQATLADDTYKEWVGLSHGTWIWRGKNTLDFGWSVREMSDAGFLATDVFGIPRLASFRGDGQRVGAYLQQSVPLWEERLVLLGGVRWDHHNVNDDSVVLPYASVRLKASSSTSLSFAWGKYAQYAEINQFFSSSGRTTLRPQRSTHFEAMVEQRLSERTRLRIDAYDREDRELLFAPLFEPRLVAGQVFFGFFDAPLQNDLRGHARGFQIFLQSRTSNGLTGWISYAYGKSILRSREAQIRFPADKDQRHTVNIFGSYRVRPSVDLSLKWIYGSGFPVPGFYRKAGEEYFLTEGRNLARMPYYQRVDLRANKSFTFTRWRATLFLEVVNLLNRSNLRFDEVRQISTSTGAASLNFDDMLPILPSVGIALEF